MTTLQAALTSMRQRFADGAIADGAMEARILLAGLLGIEPGQTVLEGDRLISDGDLLRIEAAIVRRLAGEPVHRILGHRAFHVLDLNLSKETLEPRPDTEILVETVVRLAKTAILSGQMPAHPSIIDLGTGTGAIALALLVELPGASALGTDISEDALKTAMSNAVRHGLQDRFSIQKSHWFQAVSGTFDIIVSNPPYIATKIIANLAPEVRLFDPIAALDGGSDGLDAYRVLAQTARGHLAPGGLLAVEIGYDQKDSVTALFENAGFTLLEAVTDLGGHDRVLAFCA